MLRTYMLAVAAVLCFDGPCNLVPASERRLAPQFTVEVITKKREFRTGEPWVIELKAVASAPSDHPLQIRAWSRFFAEYDVVPECHGPIDESNLSDVLSTGGQVWRDGAPVVLWNAPNAEVFGKAKQTTLAPNSDISATLCHDFGVALKAGRFRRKAWFAIVIEPSPNKFMLLFARTPVDITFIADGEEITFESFAKQQTQREKKVGIKLHDRQTIADPSN